jgi:hypothetical protein
LNLCSVNHASRVKFRDEETIASNAALIACLRARVLLVASARTNSEQGVSLGVSPIEFGVDHHEFRHCHLSSANLLAYRDSPRRCYLYSAWRSGSND